MREIADDEILNFAQKNANYYLLKWRVMEITQSRISWNWASCLFGVFWLVYRKMYFYALAVMAFIFVESYKDGVRQTGGNDLVGCCDFKPAITWMDYGHGDWGRVSMVV